MELSRFLTQELLAGAYRSGDEFAWPVLAAKQAIDQLSLAGIAVVGIEVWVPTHPGPTLPSPYVYHWTMREKAPAEKWKEFVADAAQKAALYIDSFRWDDKEAFISAVPHFNLTDLSQSEYEKG